MGWISGVIILIFLILYIFYVLSSYYLAKGNKEIPPKATINFDNCKDTIEDFDENYLFSGSNKSSKGNLKKGDTKVNLISVDRNSLTPNLNLEKK
jgi:hypothetical protein